jgi:Right handed beta helix region
MQVRLAWQRMHGRSVSRLQSALLRLGWIVTLWLAAACSGDGGGNSGEPGDCKVDSDCSGSPATPYCSAAKTCVGCEDSSQCSGATPTCDLPTTTCRACSADSECASGVCLEVAGTCASAAQLIYVKEAGGADNSTCELATPCATINYAKSQIMGERNVIRVIGALSAIAELQSKVTIDGDGSKWTAAAGSIVSVGTANGDVTIEGFNIEGPTGPVGSPAVDCLNMASLRLHQVTIAKTKISQVAISAVCKVAITNSKIIDNVGGGVKCSDGGSISIEDTEMRNNTGKSVDAQTCKVRLLRNRISGNASVGAMVTVVSPPELLIENNLMVDSQSVASSGISVTNAPDTGAIRFNTLVNTATLPHTGTGIACNGAAGVVTSNVIAWQGASPLIATPCQSRYNAFDSTTAVGAGVGNTSATMVSLFVNPASDFRLAVGSPALGLGEPGATIAVDLEGKPRPTTGRADAGAFETP